MTEIPESQHPVDAASKASSHRWEGTFPASISSVVAITEKIDELLDAVDCPFKSRTQVDIALDEILSNIAKFAYKAGKGDVMVSAAISHDPLAVTITTADEGEPFDPLTVPPPDTSLPLEKRKVGGLGIMLVRKMMNEVSYVREGSRNLLTIRKEL